MTTDRPRRAGVERLRETQAQTVELWQRAAETIQASAWIRGDRPGVALTLSLDGARLLGCCAWCGRLRNRSGHWARVPDRFRPADCKLSHTICPVCWTAECPELPYPT